METRDLLIPKVIHYCWLSGDPYPLKIRRCMDTWRRVMPDYRLKLWTTDNFDVASVPYVKEAYEHRKWAFAADYIRMYALYTEGGIYLDSDVKVLKPFDDFLSCSFFSSVEHHPTQLVKTDTARLIAPDGSRTGDGYVSGMQIQAAVMGAQAGCPFVKEVLDWYQGRHFVREDGSLETQLLAPQIYARVAERHGFLYKDMDQQLDGNVKILRSEIFAGNKHEVTPASYAIHLCAHSWHDSAAEKLRKLLCFAALIGVIFIVVKTLAFGDPVEGWPSLACLITLLGGIQLLCLGIMGQYLAKTYLETKHRPLYIVRESSDDSDC